jgi:hypothetical protein
MDRQMNNVMMLGTMDSKGDRKMAGRATHPEYSALERKERTMKNSKLVMILGLGLLAAGCGLFSDQAVESAQPVMHFNLAPEEVEEAPEPDVVVAAKELIDQGLLKDALVMLEGGLSRTPQHIAAMELLVQTRRTLAREHTSQGQIPHASFQLDRAIAQVKYYRQWLLANGISDKDWLNQAQTLSSELLTEIRTHFRTAMQRAEGLYREAKGFWNDDEELFIQGLIILDGVKGVLKYAPRNLRESYARTWIKLHDELWDSDRAEYDARTQLVNGAIE